MEHFTVYTLFKYINNTNLSFKLSLFQRLIFLIVTVIEREIQNMAVCDNSLLYIGY